MTVATALSELLDLDRKEPVLETDLLDEKYYSFHFVSSTLGIPKKSLQILANRKAIIVGKNGKISGLSYSHLLAMIPPTFRRYALIPEAMKLLGPGVYKKALKADRLKVVKMLGMELVLRDDLNAEKKPERLVLIIDWLVKKLDVKLTVNLCPYRSLEVFLEALPDHFEDILKFTSTGMTYRETAAVLECSYDKVNRAVSKSLEYLKSWLQLVGLGWSPEECLSALLVLDHIKVRQREAIWAFWIEQKTREQIETDLGSKGLKDLKTSLTYIQRRYKICPGRPLRELGNESRLPSKQSPTLQRIYKHLILNSASGKVRNAPKDLANETFPELSEKEAYSKFWAGLNWLKENGWVEYPRVLGGEHKYLIVRRAESNGQINWLETIGKDTTVVEDTVVDYNLVFWHVLLLLRDKGYSGTGTIVFSLGRLLAEALFDLYSVRASEAFLSNAAKFSKKHKILIRSSWESNRLSYYCLGDGGKRIWHSLCSKKESAAV